MDTAATMACKPKTEVIYEESVMDDYKVEVKDEIEDYFEERDNSFVTSLESTNHDEKNEIAKKDVYPVADIVATTASTAIEEANSFPDPRNEDKVNKCKDREESLNYTWKFKKNDAPNPSTWSDIYEIPSGFTSCKVALKRLKLPSVEHFNLIYKDNRKITNNIKSGKEEEMQKKTKQQSHFAVHTGNKSYCCSDCLKCFTCESHLLNHICIHTGENPFSCSVCSKCFSDKSDLVKHSRIHTGEKLFTCSVCSKSFSKRSYLVTHLRIHTGEKPYSCSVCLKCFSTKSNLSTHSRIHTVKKRYTCSVCSKNFSQKINFTSHSLFHTGKKFHSY